jgi:hypothetical protein
MHCSTASDMSVRSRHAPMKLKRYFVLAFAVARRTVVIGQGLAVG